MTKISETQRAILIAAARREDGSIRLPARVKGGGRQDDPVPDQYWADHRQALHHHHRGTRRDRREGGRPRAGRVLLGKRCAPR